MTNLGTIGIDYTPAYEQGGGIGRYVRELVTALAKEDTNTHYKLFVAGVDAPEKLPDLPGENFSWHTTRVTPRWLARLWHRANIPYPVEQLLGDITLFHATDFVLPPTRHDTRTLVTVHDLSFVHVPETAEPRLKKYLDVMVPRSVKKADHILADSAATKADLVTLYNTPSDKITILLSGVDPHFRPIEDTQQQTAVREKYGLGTWPYLFTIGTVQPRKNYTRMCEALAIMHTSTPDLHLVIAGGKGWLEDPIHETVQRLQLGQHVHFIGFADDQDLPALYSAAAAVPYVSLYEGFGLPVLEAMACGTPVIASNLSSIPEVAGNAALLVDPTDSAAIATAIQTVLDKPMLQKQLIDSGYQQARQFTWQKSAQNLLQVYRQVTTT
ncbi:glycosyltransferase family 4 protein [Chloroflexota bacterium]